MIKDIIVIVVVTSAFLIVGHYLDKKVKQH